MVQRIGGMSRTAAAIARVLLVLAAIAAGLIDGHKWG
jgi:hypothetical protein